MLIIPTISPSGEDPRPPSETGVTSAVAQSYTRSLNSFLRQFLPLSGSMRISLSCGSVSAGELNMNSCTFRSGTGGSGGYGDLKIILRTCIRECASLGERSCTLRLRAQGGSRLCWRRELGSERDQLGGFVYARAATCRSCTRPESAFRRPLSREGK